MSRFGYSPEQAEKIASRLDGELRSVEYRLDRIRSTVPQAGATVARLDEARDIARSVVDDLHDVIRERTEEASGGPSAGGPATSLTAMSIFGFDYWTEPASGGGVA